MRFSPTRRRRYAPAALAGVLLLMLAGCASTPGSDVLQQAQAEYDAAISHARIYDFGNRNLQEAERHLRRAQELQAESESREIIEHHAFMARQYVAMAEAQLQRGLTREQIAQADQRRRAMLLQAQERQVTAASGRAAEAEAELEESEAELAAAETRAQTLSERVGELEVERDERGTVFTLSDVVFDFDSDELSEGGERTVAQIAETVEQYPQGQILIEGFTDSFGAEDYNQQLSERRAEAVKKAFVEAGIDAERIQVDGHGEAYPVASNDTAEGRQLNRRVEIVVSTDGREVARRGDR